MFVKFGLHQAGAGGILNTTLLASGKNHPRRSTTLLNSTAGEVPSVV